MDILPARFACLVAVLALSAAGCGTASRAAAFDAHQRFEAPGQRAIDVRISIQPEHRRHQQRYIAAAVAALKQSSEWLGPFPHASLTIVDPPWQGPTTAGGTDVVVLDRTPWWSASTSMTPELAVARAVSRRRWAEAMPGGSLPSWFIQGLVEYSARRAIVPLFEAENLSPGYAFLEQPFFGGFVHWFVRIRLLAETDGEPLQAYRANPAGNPALQTPSAADALNLQAKTVLTLGTLERWVGRPVFDQLVSTLVRQSRAGRHTLDDFSRIATDVSGQDLSWLFDETFGSARTFDYGIGRLTSDRQPEGAFDTVVVVRRLGEAVFTGTSAAPIGSFESGRGIALRVTFEDGQQRDDYWDGRSREKTFHYRSPARAASAMVDPDRTLLLDLHQTNNSMTLAPRARTAATLWAARWMAWLEHALLNYGALV